MMCYMCVNLKYMNDILLIKEFVVMNVCIVIMKKMLYMLYRMMLMIIKVVVLCQNVFFYNSLRFCILIFIGNEIYIYWQLDLYCGLL